MMTSSVLVHAPFVAVHVNVYGTKVLTVTDECGSVALTNVAEFGTDVHDPGQNESPFSVYVTPQAWSSSPASGVGGKYAVMVTSSDDTHSPLVSVQVRTLIPTC